MNNGGLPIPTPASALESKTTTPLKKKPTNMMTVEELQEAGILMRTAPDDVERAKYKICLRCGRSLPLDQFGSNRLKKDGKNIYCRECCHQLRLRYTGKSIDNELQTR